jgi:hypothetical protein
MQMADTPVGLDMPRLIERVHAAARMIRGKSPQFRRLTTRSREQFDPASGWMVPLNGGTPELYAVELVPCDEDDLNAVAIHRDHDSDQLRLDAQVLYDLWAESLPADALR